MARLIPAWWQVRVLRFDLHTDISNYVPSIPNFTKNHLTYRGMT